MSNDQIPFWTTGAFARALAEKLHASLSCNGHYGVWLTPVPMKPEGHP